MRGTSSKASRPNGGMSTERGIRLRLALVCIAVCVPVNRLSAAHNPTLETLESIGYVDSMPADNTSLRGVVKRDGDAYRGWNLLSSRHRASAELVDMDGVVQHRWEEPGGVAWMHVELLPNGDLLALAKDHYLVRLDHDSNVVWRLKHRVHHDFAVLPDGRILALARRLRRKTYGGIQLPILEDVLIWVREDGKIQKGRSLFSLVKNLIPSERIQSLIDAVQRGETPFSQLAWPEYLGDVTHTNSVKVLHRDIPGVAPAGSLLFSFRELSRIAITDANATEVLWVWGRGELEEQHHATQLTNGNLMVFDNGVHRERSRVLEIRPARREIVWWYTHSSLFTRLRGSAQRLPNGNVLITESDSGHVIEVTRAGALVWEFWNPYLRDVRGQTERDSIYRLLRYPRSFYSAAAESKDTEKREFSFLRSTE